MIVKIIIDDLCKLNNVFGFTAPANDYSKIKNFRFQQSLIFCERGTLKIINIIRDAMMSYVIIDYDGIVEIKERLLRVAITSNFPKESLCDISFKFYEPHKLK